MYHSLWSARLRQQERGQSAGHLLHGSHCGRSSGGTCTLSPLAPEMHPEWPEISIGGENPIVIYISEANLVSSKEVVSLEQFVSDVPQRLSSGQSLSLENDKVPTVQCL